MKRIVALALMAALAFTVSGCSSSSSSGGGTSAGTVKVTEADQGKTVEAKVGDTLVVALAGNPSTGYAWVAKDVPSFLKLEGEPTFVKSDNSGAVGAGGTLEIKFGAAAAGSGELLLDYKRPWETTATPAKTFSATVTVK